MLNIAIIGAGAIGEIHAQCLSALGNPPALIADRDRSRAEHLAERYSAAYTADPLEAIHSTNIDAVYICTYHDTHAPLAIEAAQNGKHIFLEKPMALTEKACYDILAEVRLSDVLCMTGFKLHYYSLARKAKELVPKPIALTAHVIDSRWPDDHWANDPMKGGGNVLSQGCHAVELLSHLAGSEPIRIFAEGGNMHHPKLDIIDTMAATLAFENGAVASLFIGDVGEDRHNGKFSFQAMNGTQSLHLYHRLTELHYFDGNSEQIFSGEEDGFLNENREFLSAMEDDREPETTEVHGLRAEFILLKGIQSIRTGMPQSLEEIP